MNLKDILKSKNNVLLIVFVMFILAYRVMISFSYSPEISVGETNNIWNSLNVANGKDLYSNPENTPFEIFQYTPLSQIPTLIAAHLFDSESNNYTYNVMVIGRLFNLLFNLLTFYLIFLLLKNRLKVSNTLSLAASVCGFGLLTHLSFAIRPDSMSLFLIIISIYFFSKAYFQEKRYYFIIAGFSFAFSFFAKQDSFLILSALLCCLLLQRNWKYFFVLATVFILSISLLLVLFKLIFGQFFFISIFGGITVEPSIYQAFAVFERFLHFYGVIFYSTIFLSFMLLKNIKLQKEITFLLLLTWFSFAIAVSTSLKLGSWINYYTQFIIYAIVFIFYAVHQMNDKSVKNIFETAMVSLSIILISVFLVQQVYHYTAPFIKYNESKEKHASIVKNFGAFKKEATENDYVIFSFDKRLRLLLYRNTIFPNTEFYHISKFSFEKYKKLNSKDKLTHYISDSTLNQEQFYTLRYYNIDLSTFSEKSRKLNYRIFETIDNK